MDLDSRYLTHEECVGYTLRKLYAGFGYSPYKLSKFEPYDLYAENRSFLAGEHILTFHDLNGKLMALKPDLTLSIMKNYRAGQQKVYYNEYVYREGSGEREFREIPQAGIECIGKLDAYEQFEVLYLAAESMKRISEKWILNVASMRTVEGLLEETDTDKETRNALLTCLRQKNVPGMEKQCRIAGLDDTRTAAWKTAAALYGPLSSAIGRLEAVTMNDTMRGAVEELRKVQSLFDMTNDGACVHLDFSIISDRSYYNGIVFKGFAQGVHTEVLSGGRYDHLAEHLGKKAEAIGFAVYLDLLNQIFPAAKRSAPDVRLCYGASADPKDVFQKALALRQEGKSVFVESEESDTNVETSTIFPGKDGIE